MAADGRFRTTHWSLVLRAARAGEPAGGTPAAEALEGLAQCYWYPLYAYVRRRGYREEDALDLTQGFFARLFERGDLATAAPERGRFRAFLLTALQHHLAGAAEEARALKRGGGRAPLSIDASAADTRYAGEPSHAETPERLYERAWAKALLARTLERLEADYAARGKRELFEALKGVLAGGDAGATYAEIGRTLGLSEGAVKVAVYRLRARYRAELWREVAETLADPAEVEDELRRLFQALE
jgi:RNA polymerase sigma-70 factor (ECF subfamily)